MAEFPFQLLIERFAEKQTETLTCTALLRAIAGTREVYEATWNGRGVIVKVFSHKFSANRHLKREWRGLSLLRQRQLSSPEPLFFGKTKNGQRAMVVEKILDSSTVLDVFSKTTDTAEKLALLVLVCKQLAKQHSKGVLQKDLHLGNFLLKEGRIFTIDPTQMRFSSGEIGKKKSLSQIAGLANNLPADETESTARLCRQYAAERHWHLGESARVLFQKQMTVHRKRAVKRGLKKCLRTSKRHLRIKTNGCVAVFDRDFCQGAETGQALDFIEQVDALMDAGRILKNGNTCYVSRLTWNGRDVVVKRYNHKGFIHSLRHTIKRSRARRGWLYGHRLGMLNIATPKPAAYIERRKGALVWKSYLVTEYAKGRKLYDFLRDASIPEPQREEETAQVEQLLDKLGKHRISHGDLKHTNILITADGPSIIDLDAMTVHKCRWVYNLMRAKDLGRFAKHCRTCRGPEPGE